MRLPLEVIEKIYEYLPFEKVTCLSKRVSNKIYDPEVHTWDYVLNKYDVYIPTLEFLNEKDYYGIDEFLTETVIFKQKHVLKWFLENKREYFTNDLFESLLFEHKFDTVEIMLYNGFDINNVYISNSIISNESVEILIWLHRKNIKIPNHVLFRAIRSNLLVIIQWFVSFKKEAFNEIDVSTALLNARSDTVYYLYKYGFRNFTNLHIESAVAQNDFELVTFYESIGLQIKNYMSCYFFIARNGNMNMLRYMYYKKNYTDIPPKILSCAAGNGHLEMLKWLVEKGYNCEKETIECAIINDHFHTVEWLYENTFIDSSSKCLKSAVGNLKMVKWLYENNKVDGVPGSDAMSDAVYYSCFESLKYMAEKGGVCDEDAVEIAASNNRLDIVEWLLERGYTSTSESIYYACQTGNLEMLKLLLTDQEIDSHAMIIAAENNNINIINFLYDKGISVTYPIIKAAVENGFFELTKWLYSLLDNEKSYYHTRTIFLADIAIEKNYISLAKWLIAEKKLYITYSSLISCVTNGNLGMLLILLNHFDISLPNNYVKKLEDIAAKKKFLNIQKILLNLK